MKHSSKRKCTQTATHETHTATHTQRHTYRARDGAVYTITLCTAVLASDGTIISLTRRLDDGGVGSLGAGGRESLEGGGAGRGRR